MTYVIVCIIVQKIIIFDIYVFDPCGMTYNIIHKIIASEKLIHFSLQAMRFRELQVNHCVFVVSLDDFMSLAPSIVGPTLDFHLLLVYFSGLRFQGQPELPRQNIRLPNFFQYHWMAFRDPSKLGSNGIWRPNLFVSAVFEAQHRKNR